MPPRTLLALLGAAVLAGCAATQSGGAAPSWALVQEMEPDRAWRQTWKLPDAEQTPRRIELIELWAEQRQWDAVTAGLQRLGDSDLHPTQHQRLQLVQARHFLAMQRDPEALRMLESLPASTPVLELQLQAYDRQPDPEAALRTRLQLVAFAAEPERHTHYRTGWKQLLEEPASRLQAWRGRAVDGHWRGWLDLALLARPGEHMHLPLAEILREWQHLYPKHPATAWLPDITTTAEALRPKLQRVAALLPVSGELATIGKTIRDGIEARMREQFGETPELRIYDTGDPAQSAQDLYRRAVAEGADRIIGPFSKQAVIQLARQEDLPVGTVSLNYLNPGADAPNNLYQFGLLPEDEAAQAADRALQDGRRAAVAFAPDSAWGRRLLKAFAQRFEAGGGTVKERGLYFAEASDYAAMIKRVLKLAEGEARQQQLEETLGLEVVSRPTRRQDIDMVFLASSPHNARLLKPQLDFYFADDLPTYATSHIYTGVPSPLQDRDLDGIMFCDIPLVLDAPRLAKLNPAARARELPRFVALGADAYLLATRLSYLEPHPDATLDGWTGQLALQGARQVFRGLQWARFEDGEAQALP